MNRGVHIPQGKFISWELTVGGHVPLPEEQQQLVFGKLWIDFAKRQHVECQVPCSILKEKCLNLAITNNSYAKDLLAFGFLKEKCFE